MVRGETNIDSFFSADVHHMNNLTGESQSSNCFDPSPFRIRVQGSNLI
jgi:hypothetical protein